MQAAREIIPVLAVQRNLNAARLCPGAHRVAVEDEVDAVSVVRIVVNAARDIAVLVLCRNTEVQNHIAAERAKGNAGGHIALDQTLELLTAGCGERAAPAGAVRAFVHELTSRRQIRRKTLTRNLCGRSGNVDHALTVNAVARDGDVRLVAAELHSAVAVLRILLALGVEIEGSGVGGGDRDGIHIKIRAVRVAEDQREALRHLVIRDRGKRCRTAAAGERKPLDGGGHLHRQIEVGEGVAAVGVAGVRCKGACAQRENHDDSQKHC